MSHSNKQNKNYIKSNMLNIGLQEMHSYDLFLCLNMAKGPHFIMTVIEIYYFSWPDFAYQREPNKD